MSSLEQSTKTVAVAGKTVPQAYLQRIEISADQPVFLVKREGAYQPLLWREFHDRVLAVVDLYESLGIATGDRVCIVSQSRPEWSMADIANLCLGIVTVPIYHSSSADDTAYILTHCEPKAVFVEDGVQLAKVQHALSKGSTQLPLIIFSPPADCPASVIAFSKLTKKNAHGSQRLRETSAKITPQSLATIVYTSGTTGTPKGAALSQENLAAEINGVTEAVHFYPGDTTLAFLPFAHVLGRVESLLPVFTGVRLAFAESINSVPQNIAEVRPTILVSVPRIYEKIYAKIQSEISAAPPIKKTIFDWSVGVGKAVARLRSENQPVPLLLSAKYAVADRLVFEKIRNKLGGKIRFAISGGAPLSPELAEFFFACGIKILEGYGLTETTAAVTCNRPEDICFGSVGKPLPGQSVRIAADGEIQMKGTAVFREYYKNPSATKEVFTEDGWFCSGDIGEFNPRGFLKITDRKKEIIVTSGGKNIAPQKLENLLKTNRFVSSAMVYGDKEKYLVVLLTPNEAEVMKWAGLKKIANQGIGDLVKNAEVLANYEEAVRLANQSLAAYESIKRFRLLTQDFTVETGELTPSLKIKRKVITQKYRAEIDQLYDR